MEAKPDQNIHTDDKHESYGFTLFSKPRSHRNDEAVYLTGCGELDTNSAPYG